MWKSVKEGRAGREETEWKEGKRRGKDRLRETDWDRERAEPAGAVGGGCERGQDTGSNDHSFDFLQPGTLPGLRTEATRCFLNRKLPRLCGRAEPFRWFLLLLP